MRSLPFPRRLQLVKLLRAHGVKDVERLREDELRDALARLSILLPDLAADDPFGPPLPTSATSSIPPGSREIGADADAVVVAAIDEDADDPHALPRFREPKVFLPEGSHTFARAIAVKPGELFVNWQLRDDVVDGAAFLQVYAVEFFGRAPGADDILASVPRLVFDVDRASHGWYVHLPLERWALVVRVVVRSDDGDVVVATSNVALTPPAKRGAAGPLWLASLDTQVDRRVLRGESGLLGLATLPAGVVVTAAGTVDEHGAHFADGVAGAGGARGLHSSSSSSSSSSSAPWSARPSLATSSTMSRGKEQA